MRNIEPVEGQDMLFQEIEEYTMDDDVNSPVCILMNFGSKLEN